MLRVHDKLITNRQELRSMDGSPAQRLGSVGVTSCACKPAAWQGPGFELRCCHLQHSGSGSDLSWVASYVAHLRSVVSIFTVLE